jgi:hypothetical protein
MKEIIEEYKVDLKRGKIYKDENEVSKCESINEKKIASFIDDSIDDQKSLKRILNAWTFIFGLPKSIITNKENPWYSQKKIEYNVSEKTYDDIIDETDAILLITDEEDNHSLDIVKFFNKDIYFIDFKKFVQDDSFLLTNIIYQEDEKKRPETTKRNPRRSTDNKYWLPKDYFMKI